MDNTHDNFIFQKGLETYTRNFKLYIIVIINTSAILTHINIRLLKFIFPNICYIDQFEFSKNNHKTPVSI